MSDFLPRWYQTECCEVILESIKDKRCHPIAAIPTGAGKTHIISMIIERYIKENPNKHIIVLSHVHTILKQNYDSLTKHVDEEVGLYSASLNSRVINRITVAGIQSVYKRPNEFGDVGLIIIDECHLVSDDNSSMYKTFLANFSANCVGLTATPYRSRGYLHQIENALFTTIAYDLTSSVNFKKLIADGFLCKLLSKATDTNLDTKGLKTVAGDYSLKQMSGRFDTDKVTEAALDEAIITGKNYKRWLIFAIDIQHAENIADYLNSKGVNTGVIHSQMEDDRDIVLEDFKSGFYRAAVNVNMLTTGVDIPDIDLIILLRPTKSPVIYVQSVGRGLRPHPNKDHTLVLDYANNVSLHGPVDSVIIRNKGEKKDGDAPTKECHNCQCIMHPVAKFCDACGYEFQFKVNVNTTASDLDIIKKSEIKWLNVDKVIVNRHKKARAPDSIRLDFLCGLRRYSVWCSIDSPSEYAVRSARYVLNKFHSFPEGFIYTVSNIVEVGDKFKAPKKILVDNTDQYPRIQEFEFGEEDAGNISEQV